MDRRRIPCIDWRRRRWPDFVSQRVDLEFRVAVLVTDLEAEQFVGAASVLGDAAVALACWGGSC